MLTVTAPVIMRNVWSMSVQMTAEKPPKMVKRPHMHKRMMMETYIVDGLCESVFRAPVMNSPPANKSA